uniref:Secretin/TonB short N-terminal domain-containing protein n=1 Tax=candidate division WOR-3 bacterium TaxID=2052148 RepID=A0A7C2P4S2_UNCW3
MKLKFKVVILIITFGLYGIFLNLSSVGASSTDSVSILERLMKGEKEYSGTRISLDLKDADLPNVLRLFADVAKVNILVTEEVKGKVTLRLLNVPWDQALDIILVTNNLGMEWVGNVIRISTLERLQKEKEARAQTKVAEEAIKPVSTELIPVSYSKASRSCS